MATRSIDDWSSWSSGVSAAKPRHPRPSRIALVLECLEVRPLATWLDQVESNAAGDGATQVDL